MSQTTYKPLSTHPKPLINPLQITTNFHKPLSNYRTTNLQKRLSKISQTSRNQLQTFLIQPQTPLQPTQTSLIPPQTYLKPQISKTP